MQNCLQRDAVSNHFSSPVRNKAPKQQDDSGKQFSQFLFYLSSFLLSIRLACWSQPRSLLLASLSLLSFSYSSLLSPRSFISASRLSIRGAPAIQFPCARSPLSVSAPLSCSLRVDFSPLPPFIARHHLLGDGGRKKPKKKKTSTCKYVCTLYADVTRRMKRGIA